MRAIGCGNEALNDVIGCRKEALGCENELKVVEMGLLSMGMRAMGVQIGFQGGMRLLDVGMRGLV